MAWETRRKQRYYYQKRRLNGRVISKYIGAGAEASAREEMTAQRKLAAESELRERLAFRALEGELANFTQQVHTLAAAALLTAGYHRHKREWRLEREAATN